MEEPFVDKILSSLVNIANDENRDHLLREKIVSRFIDIVEAKVVQEEKINRLGNSCVICWKKQSNYIFIPCGHFCFCDECVETLKRTGRYLRCPICRTIGEYHKVFASNKISEYTTRRSVSTLDEVN